ncbi:MAG: tRNA pseudouridine(38-40) synthase TruA [Chloroflexota bacterium]
MPPGQIVVIMEYAGTRYGGFQWQANAATVQDETSKALHRLTGERTRVMAASRTDSGVHARGQVVCLSTGSSLPVKALVSGLNHYLPDDIAVRSAHRVPDTFNVRRDALSREYGYYILNRPARSPLWSGRAYQVKARLDIKAMNQASQGLLGQHDMASFVTGDATGIKSTVRSLYRAEAEWQGDMVIYRMVANAFLPHQVRNTVGALIRVGLGKMSVSQFYDIIEAKKPGLAWPTAPACGLYLERVNYAGPFEETM